MQALGAPVDLVKQFISNFERKRRNLVKRKTKLDSYREKLQRGEALEDDQIKAVEGYDGVLQSIALMQEAIENSKVLLSDIEDSVRKQEPVINVQLERHTVDFITLYTTLHHLLNSLDSQSVRMAVTKVSSEAHLKLLDALHKFMTPSLGANWPQPVNVPSFLQGHEELKLLSSNIYDFVTGRSVAIPFQDDLLESVKKITNFKEVRNLCFRLLGNPLVQQALRATHNVATSADSEVQSAATCSENTEEIKQEPKCCELSPIDVQDYVVVEAPTTTFLGEPAVDQVIRPFGSTFKFLQASRVVPTEMPVSQSNVYPDLPNMNNLNLSEVDNNHSNSISDDACNHQDAIVTSADMPDTDPAVVSPVMVNTIQSYQTNIPPDHDVHMMKPISYADSVRKSGQNVNQKEMVLNNSYPMKKIEQQTETANSKEAERPYDASRPNKRESRNYNASKFRGRGNTVRRAGRGFGDRSNFNRGMSNGIAQASY